MIFLAVDDGEAGGTGTEWFIERQGGIFGNGEFLVNGGGENLLEGGKVEYVGVDVGEKTTFWLHVVAHGRPGHGSRPIADAAPNRLVRGLERILDCRTPVKGLPVVVEFFGGKDPYQPPRRKVSFGNDH